MQAKEIKKVASIGAGVIGSSWATNFAMKGYPVCVYDINPDQLITAKQNVASNLEFLVAKGILTTADAAGFAGMVTYSTSLEAAVRDVQFIQECGPEKYAIKQQVVAEVEKYASPEAIIASSTSGLLITEIVKYAQYPERCVGAHPYNPPHLIPLVEITKGEKSSLQAVQCAYDFYAMLGKEPVVLHKETLGFIANRLQRALTREATDLVMRGVCSVEDVDKAVLFGPGLRWAVLGPNLIMHLGGGAQGIKGLVNHIRDSGNLWLQDMAQWTEEPVDWADIAQDGVLEEMAHRPAEFGRTSVEIAEFRDHMLIEILKLHKKL